MSLFWTVSGFSQDFRTLFGHEHGMLKLRRCLAILGANRPTIILVESRVTTAHIDHGLDGEAHPWHQAVDAALAIGKVGDRGIEVKLASKAVSHIFTYNGEPAVLGLRNNGLTNGGNVAARRKRVDREVHTVKCRLRDTSFILADFTDQERFALVTVPTIDDRGDVDINDVSFDQHTLIGDPVTDDFIDADATAFGVALVSERGRSMAVLFGPLVDEIVDFNCADAGLDVGTDVVHQGRIRLAGLAHRVAATGIKHQVTLLFQHSGHLVWCQEGGASGSAGRSLEH